MRKVSIIIICFLLSFNVVISDAFARAVKLVPVSAGNYENGSFTPAESGLEAEYYIDEKKGIVVLEDIFKNNREGRISKGAVYDITNVVHSEGISGLLVSLDKKGQRIITAVREDAYDAIEVIIIGSDFYDYCRAANGKFYLEHGKAVYNE